MSVLTELGVARSVPLDFDRPALPHQPEQRFWARAQGGDEQVHVVKRLTVMSVCTHQLDDPAGSMPALKNGACGIAGTESPANLAALSGLEIADQHRKVPVSAERGDVLLIQPALVVIDRQEQTGALFGGEL
jgi:hypothetical protein